MSARMSFERDVERLAEGVVAEQLPGARDHRVDVGVLVAGGRVGRQVAEHLGRGTHQRATDLLHQLVRDRVQVVAAVAVARERELLAEALEVAQPHADREDLHLPAGVVDVVLAVHLVARGVEQVRERRAEGGVAAVADVQRPGGIGRNELDQHAPAGAELAAAVGGALVRDPQQFLVVGGRRQEEIDEARARDLDPGDEVALRQRIHDRLCDFPWLALRRLCDLHRRVRGEVAVGRVARAFDGRRCRGRFGGPQLGGKCGEGVPHQVFYQVFQGVAVRRRGRRGRSV